MYVSRAMSCDEGEGGCEISLLEEFTPLTHHCGIAASWNGSDW
jgi:hypothetical protein